MKSVAGLLIAVLICISSFTLAPPGDEVYRKYCAGCHGGQLQGGAATALIKPTWKFGNDRASILHTIRTGIPKTEMIKWQGVIPDADIQAVTDYILKAQHSPQIVKKEKKPLLVKTKLYSLRIQELITRGITDPYGIEFVNAHRALITGKRGELYWVLDGKLDTHKITGVPETYAYDNFGGLMDLALDPDYAKTGWIYLAYSHNTVHSKDKKTPGMTRIVRGKIKNYQWQDEQVLFQVPDSLQVGGGTRWGCRFLIDKQGYLYFTIGDMDHAAYAQDLAKPAGKVYRIHRDGSIPTDNPFYGQTDRLQAIYTWGNRNAQGIAQHPVTGLIYETEHGPQGGDELNLLKSGANYGWPAITYGIGYDGSIISNETSHEGMEQPVTYWTPSIAVSAIEFVKGPLFLKWKNNLLVTALKYQEVRRLVINKDKVTEQEILLKGYGRVRDVKIGPDGAIYVITNSPDALLRITPR
ncbi:PQQ-dependent sugar dehydrogenase [[Flexibacter] sp. ATCC 35208]|uniref:PQQ-dependent sugar dehydrogenase n=1 Tax=[Flexibacter] sp. ATCC 35208 TaxID=1936242 RepID=UPI0009CF78C7|nr:PQQ-dependent sugar dehydrogenase [[Flexibacter] sp. ATCC 35208]OMP74944.1 glucose sorbosone dehydrogenase [[Flexibacter] sp. ATCC 35208]